MKASNNLPVVALPKDEAVAMMRSATLERAMEQGQPLCDALDCAKVATVDALHAMLAEVAKFHGAAEYFKESQRLDVVKALADNYGHLSVDEIALVFSRARTPDGSRDSKVFGQLTPAVVLGWVGTYANSDERVKYWERINNASTEYITSKDDAGNLIRHREGNQSQSEGTGLLELFAPMLRRLAGGQVAPNGKVAEYKPAALTVPLKPGSAAWFRAEADRVEAREAADVARKELAKAKVQGMIALEPMEKDFRENYGQKAFEKFAHERFYSLLSDEEANIIREAGMGPLRPEYVEIYGILTLAWQCVIMDWEDEQVKHITKLGESLNKKSHDKAEN